MSDPARHAVPHPVGQSASEHRPAPSASPAAPAPTAVDGTAVRALTRPGDDPAAPLRRLPPSQQQQTLLALQRTVGNLAAQRVLRPAATLTIQRALSDDDLKTIAEQVHDAISGLGTDEEAIYASLQKLGKSATEIAKLKTLYKDTYKEELEAAIRGDMSGEELRFALELIGVKDDAKKPDLIGAVPGTDDEFKAAAAKIKNAVEGPGTDEEAIFAVLTPFNRDAVKLTKLRDTYKVEFKGADLEADLKGDLSGSELAYALFLLNAPPPGTPSADLTVTSPGTKDHTGKVPGGEVAVHTDVEYSNAGSPRTGAFSVGYEGGLAPDSGILQFIWCEIVATQADGSELTVAEGGLPTTNGDMELTTDPSAPALKVDSATASSPFYEAGGVDIRTTTGTTIYDRPGEFTNIIHRQFDSGATKVVERDHFDQFLIRDYKTLYHTSLVVEWVYTAKTASTRKTKFKSGDKVDGMPAAFKKQLLKEYPKFDNIQ